MVGVEHIVGSDSAKIFTTLVDKLGAKHARNQLRADFYDMKNTFRDLGIAIPPHLRNLDVVTGWPAKAVDALARRVRIDGLALPGADTADFRLDELAEEVELFALADEATTAALIHGCAFILTRAGDVGAGEPELVVTVHDAFSATGIWNPARRGLSAALVVLDVDRDRFPNRYLFICDGKWVDVKKYGFDWHAKASGPMGEGVIGLEPVVFKRRMQRPFGSSRITRAVMSITQSAMRTVARAEIGAEFFSAPQRYLLGAEESFFLNEDGSPKPVWDLMTGQLLAYPDASDASGTPMQIGQFPQVSMQPHTDQMRMWAAMFAAETSLPVSSLGIVQDNPASAEAIFASKEDLVIEAEACARSFGTAWKRTILNLVQLRDGQVDPVLNRLSIRWHDPSTPSRAQATDAILKQISAGMIPPSSDVALEQVGYSQSDIARVQAQHSTDPLGALAGALGSQSLEVDNGGSAQAS